MLMKTHRFARILLTVAGLLPGLSLRAQWQDSFDDGLEAWQGMKACFETVDGQLRSKGPEKSSRIGLSRPFLPEDADSVFYKGVLAGDSTLCLDFGIDLGFVPSSTNRLRIYLFAEDSALSDTSVACYMQLGQKGSVNTWQLYHATSDTLVRIWQGERVYSKQNMMKFNLRVVYRPYKAESLEKGSGKSGFLQVYHSTGDPLAASWEADGDSVPATIFPMQNPVSFHTGVVAIYQTASRATQYAFDHMAVYRLPPEREVLPDTVPLDTVVQDVLHQPVPVEGALVINEILFNPRQGESRFVEICNLTDTSFQMKNLALGIPDGGKWRYSFMTKDSALQIEAYAYKAAAKDAKSIGKTYRRQEENIFTASAFPSLDSKAGRLRLAWLPPVTDTVRDTVFIDEVAYNQEWHHWLLPDAEGVSLERLRADRSGMEASNWTSAAETAGYATPGGENSHVYALSGNEPVWFSFDPTVVTPDNDARNDFTFLRWNPALAGSMCNICVYDEFGRKIKTLAHELLLGADGEIRYDATDSGGRILRPGIYIVYIDLLRPDGRHKRLRYPLVVG